MGATDTRDLRKDERIARLEKHVAAFRQAGFGWWPEKSDPDQFKLAFGVAPLSAFGPRRMAGETAGAVIHAEEDAADRVTRLPSHACRSCTDGSGQAPALAPAPTRLIPNEATVVQGLARQLGSGCATGSSTTPRADVLPLYAQAQI